MNFLLDNGLQLIMLVFGTGGILWGILERKDKAKTIKKELEQITNKTNSTAAETIKEIEAVYLGMVKNAKMQLEDGMVELARQRDLDTKFIEDLKKKYEGLKKELLETKKIADSLKGKLEKLTEENRLLSLKYAGLEEKYVKLKENQNRLNGKS